MTIFNQIASFFGSFLVIFFPAPPVTIVQPQVPQVAIVVPISSTSTQAEVTKTVQDVVDIVQPKVAGIDIAEPEVVTPTEPVVTPVVQQEATTTVPTTVVTQQPISEPTARVATTSQPSYFIINQPQVEQPKQIVMTPSTIEANIDFVSKQDAESGEPFGTAIIRVSILDQDGNPIDKLPIVMTIGTTQTSRKIDTVTELHGKDYYTKFSFTPKEEGNNTVLFTSGDLTKTLDISVPFTF